MDAMGIDGIDEASLRAVVEAFYARVREDARLGPVFNGAIHDWPEHFDRLQAFWSSLMLTSGRYKGRPLPAHLKHADSITPELFSHWLHLWAETTAELLPPDAAAAMQDKAGRIAESLQLGIAFARGGLDLTRGPAPAGRAGSSG
jgi:hemoglobin